MESTLLEYRRVLEEALYLATVPYEPVSKKVREVDVDVATAFLIYPEELFAIIRDTRREIAVLSWIEESMASIDNINQGIEMLKMYVKSFGWLRADEVWAVENPTPVFNEELGIYTTAWIYGLTKTSYLDYKGKCLGGLE